MRRCAVVLVLVAFIFSSGGQWTVLQCLAWANMIREYSQVVPLDQAVQMTLSGRFPCAMCKAIADKRNSDDAKTFTLAKHDKPVLAQGFIVSSRSATDAAKFGAVPETFLQFRAEAPPVPPPRFA